MFNICLHLTPMKTIERFDKYMQYKGLNDNQVTNSLGLSNGLIGKSRKTGRDLSAKVIEQILSFYTDLNRVWLLTGEGDMIINNKETRTRVDAPKTSLTTGRPYYNVDFIGGFDLIFNDQTINPDYNIDFAPYNKDGVMWCNITGHSMEPMINNGDIIAIREVFDWQTYIPFGEVYAIVTKNDMRTVKVVRKGCDNNHINLIPINTEEYDAQEIEKSNIARIFSVLGCMKKM